MACSRFFRAAVLCAVLAAPTIAGAQVVVPRGSVGVPPGQIRQYDRGYQEGLIQGEQDARRGRAFSAAIRGNGRDEFRRGFIDGYQSGYESVRRSSAYRPFSGGGRQGTTARRLPGGYQEPAFARGYADGYQEGLNDFRGRDRYDPVGSRDYRNGDQGYYGSYGSRDAYKNNYRAGFRQGYEEGYRSGR